MKFYVYELRDEAGAVFYVGKGSGRRMYQHACKAKAKKTSSNPTLVRIRQILARGGQVIPTIVFETDCVEESFTEERRLIALHGRLNLTNQTDGGDGIRNLAAEAREKIAASRRGKKASEATRQKQREAKLGKPRSAETRAKIAAYQTGRPHPWARRPRSEEYCRKMAAIKRGVKMPPGTGAKISASKMGHEVTAETRAKISASKKGGVPWNKGKRRAK